MKLRLNLKLFVLFVFLSTSLYAQASVSINPQLTVVNSGDPVTISVDISNVFKLRSYSVKINFDNNIITYVNSFKSSFLSMNGMNSTVFLTQPTQPNVVNYVTISEAILGTAPTPGGSGTLFTVQFTPFNAGTTPVTIESVVLYDSLNNIIPVIFSSGEIKILLTVGSKIFLSGPYSGGSMLTNLNSQGLLPFAQPYSALPFSYNGRERVTANFYSEHPDIVDWVLIQLRTGLDESTKSGEAAGFILNNGSIVSIDGVSPIRFDLPSGNYYLVIKHRNHLQVISSSTISLSYNFLLYDFSASLSKAYGTDPMMLLGKNLYGLYSGDADADKQINASDRILTWNNSNIIGYTSSDVSMDGLVNASDRITVWNNRNKTTHP